MWKICSCLSFILSTYSLKELNFPPLVLNLSSLASLVLLAVSSITPSLMLVEYSFQKASYLSSEIFLIMSKVFLTSFFLITFNSLCCCRVSHTFHKAEVVGHHVLEVVGDEDSPHVELDILLGLTIFVELLTLLLAWNKK